MPVVENERTGKLIGMISLEDLLTERVGNLEQEQRRERVLPLRLIFPRRVRRWRDEDANRPSGIPG